MELLPILSILWRRRWLVTEAPVVLFEPGEVVRLALRTFEIVVGIVRRRLARALPTRRIELLQKSRLHQRILRPGAFGNASINIGGVGAEPHRRARRPVRAARIALLDALAVAHARRRHAGHELD